MSDCTLWIGQINSAGYGRFTEHRKGKCRTILAHRRSFQNAYGYLPKVVRHKCDIKLCVNPDHLEGGTQQDNMNDKRDRGRLLFGEKHQNSKLTDLQRWEIFQLQGCSSTFRVGRRFGVSSETVRRLWIGLSPVVRLGAR